MGVRKDGRLLTDQEGGGAPVDIVSPIGPQPMADSVSVTIASDQTPIPVDIGAVGTLDVNVTNASLAVTGPLTDVQLRATPVPVSGTVAVTQPVLVNQGTPNSIANGWPILVTDGSINANVNVINNGPGLVTDSGQRRGATFSDTFTPVYPIVGVDASGVLRAPAVVGTTPSSSSFGLVNKPAVLPSDILTSDIIDALNDSIILTPNYGYNSISIDIDGTFNGTIKFFLTTFFNGATFPVKLFDFETNEWITELVINGTITKFLSGRIYPSVGLFIFCTAYTSGSLNVNEVSSSVSDGLYPLLQAAKVVDTNTNYDVNDINSLTQTIEGLLRTLVGGLISDTLESHIPGTHKPLSLTTDARLRVSSEDSIRDQIWQNTFNNPWDSDRTPVKRLSAWEGNV